jgi:serine/threonine protein kinase
MFGYGRLSASYHYLDMELCDINLESWIERKWTEETKKKLPYLTADSPSRMRMSQIWDVMEDVTSAVGFIHSQHEIHRDIKPRNSNGSQLSINANFSSLLSYGPSLENCRFRSYIGGYLKNPSHHALFLMNGPHLRYLQVTPLTPVFPCFVRRRFQSFHY